ncbi:monovalent cation:proton antiporter family protein [Aquibacillus sp. 3ASR75-11]|uniref:Monovalent cation:proton antiporter family protein n=1 Tax=Terrihalobacillus insolitus TaxID=2950438 RepID=A0A9X4AM13_9BACI|nr:monovalent cation:proton antiporter family protein [Terrihalobacillus insolitus]MDC3412282.1 monovalent cation:proton antiporter family protein [Terrihalobacillus insolitus]MDC3423025.1 monovalent cation:proton antiporter family protein [Terrihalobacillus insolitus]
MEESTSVTSLIVVLIATFLTPILLKRLRLNSIPVVVAEIIVGLIIGKSGFDIVQPDPWITILSTLGFIFLMFLSGVEIDFSIFANKKSKKKRLNGKPEPNRFFVALIIFILILLFSYLISLLLQEMGLVENAFFMTLVISTISLGVVVPTLKEAEIMKSGIGQIILLVTVIADLVTMILLAVFVSFQESGGNTWLLLILFLAGIILYFVGRYLGNQSFFETMSTGTIQIGTRAVFTLIMILVGLSETVGAENILGAFLAGVLVSLLSPNKEMIKQLDSFGYGFLIPIFFVMVGVELDIWSLFQDSTVFLLIPLLFIGLLLSKFFPIMVLKRWYDWKVVIGSGFLLTSTLSLVVAAAKIGERIGVIDTRMSSALILLAIISSITAPVLFKYFFPIQEMEDSKKRIKIVGANQVTLPLSNELDKSLYEVCLYHVKRKLDEEYSKSEFEVKHIEDFSEEELRQKEVFDTDILVLSTTDDQRNYELALIGYEQGIENIVTRIETPGLSNALKEKDISVFSSFFSTKAMMKAMIESPHIAGIFATTEEGLHEVALGNSTFHNVKLRDFPFLGDSIIVRIFRESESIVPHGDTELKIGDRLIVTGSHDSISDLRELLG